MDKVKGGRIAVLGAGKMGETLIAGMLDVGIVSRNRVVATVRQEERVQALKQKYKISVGRDNRKAVKNADVVLVAVKPQAVRELLEEIGGVLRSDQVVLSVVASVTTGFLERTLGGVIPVVRAMPNTPCLLRCGMTALCKGVHAKETHLRDAQRLFSSIGRTLLLDEKYMDAVTGLSASGPAFIYIILESLAEAGVKVGLPRSVATELAAQMTLGSAKMVLETREHPATLKDIVTTPAGCTIDGILELEEGKLRVTLIKAVVKATQRAAELLET